MKTQEEIEKLHETVKEVLAEFRNWETEFQNITKPYVKRAKIENEILEWILDGKPTAKF